MAKQIEYAKELTLTRVFDAPRERVWKAWTDPKLLAQWWGPNGFTSPVCEVDPRPGGAILIHMSGFGMLAPMAGIFKEVVEPERLVFTNNAFFEVPPVKPLIEGITTVAFTDLGGKTRLTVHNTILRATPEAAQALAGMEPGWTQSLDKLAEFLRS
jgi:uncharacterized protein YndB with AHSA1/START domain